MSQWDTDYNEYIKKNTAATTKKINERTTGLNQIVDASTNQAVGKVQTEIDKLPTAYQSAYDVNAIQQKINEREVAERMANLGLTNSGLNRTQQTAINIQRANADAALTQQKNAVTASLKQQIADLYASGESQKAQNQQNVYNTFMDELEQNAITFANNEATNRAKTEAARLEAEGRAEEARIKAQQAIEEARIKAEQKAEEARIKAEEKQQERFEKWLLENGAEYDEKGNIVVSNNTSSETAKLTSAQYDDILNMYVMEQGYKNPEKFAKQVFSKYPNIDIDVVVDYLSAITMTDDGGTNFGGFLGLGGLIGLGDVGIDENGAIGYGDDQTITMKELYKRLKKAGYDEDTAEKMVIAYQEYMGI